LQRHLFHQRADGGDGDAPFDARGGVCVMWRGVVEGARDMLPMTVGLIPFGIVCGVGAISAGASPVAALAMSMIVFSGAAQIIAAQLLAAGAPLAVIVLSSAAAAYAAIGRLLHPHPVTHLAAVAIAAAVGFAGNELVARYRIRTGRRIGSAALVADGLHARTDGFTSLAVLAGAGGVAIGWRWADPVVGLLITVAIAMVGWQAAREVGRRLMDSVDPELTEKAEATLRATPGVLAVGRVRLRWVGRAIRAECEISVDPACSVVQAHDIAVSAEHALIHAIPRLAAASVHADPLDDADHHAVLAHHTALHHHTTLHHHAGAA
jgi:cation diffusion facilitator family transporter